MKNKILKVCSILLLVINTVEATTPSELTSIIYPENKTIGYGKTLSLVVELNDNMLHPVTDANPELIFDGNTTNIKYTLQKDAQKKNIYLFSIQVSDTNEYPPQDINIRVKGNYKEEAYVFKNKLVNVRFY